MGASAAVGAGARVQDGVPGAARAVPGVRDGAAGPHAHVARAAGAAQPRDGVTASAAAGARRAAAHEAVALEVSYQVATKEGNIAYAALAFLLQ